MDLIITFADSLNRWIGRSASWLNLLLVLIICFDVFMRYTFSTTSAWSIELEWHLFALIFLLGAGYAFQHDQHVRVDLFYEGFSEVKKAWINLFGCLFFVLPWCLVVIRAANKYAFYSYSIGETSPDAGGLPARFLIKYAIVAGFFLLLLQTISVMIKSVRVISGRRSEIFRKD